MKTKSTTIGVISGVIGATAGILITDQPFMLDLPFGWQLVAFAAFGAVAGLVVGLAY